MPGGHTDDVGKIWNLVDCEKLALVDLGILDLEGKVTVSI